MMSQSALGLVLCTVPQGASILLLAQDMSYILTCSSMPYYVCSSLTCGACKMPKCASAWSLILCLHCPSIEPRQWTGRFDTPSASDLAMLLKHGRAVLADYCNKGSLVYKRLAVSTSTPAAALKHGRQSSSGNKRLSHSFQGNKGPQHNCSTAPTLTSGQNAWPATAACRAATAVPATILHPSRLAFCPWKTSSVRISRHLLLGNKHGQPSAPMS